MTEKFPIELLLEMMDSSVKNLGEFEYDKQNRLQRQKTQVSPNNVKWDLPPLPLYRNRFITKKFLIETILERTDSSTKNVGELEYDKQNGLQHHET